MAKYAHIYTYKVFSLRKKRGKQKIGQRKTVNTQKGKCKWPINMRMFTLTNNTKYKIKVTMKYGGGEILSTEWRQRYRAVLTATNH